MTDLICRKTMQRCQTPGMCRPHGGCRPDQGFESEHMDLGKFVDWVWSLKAERDQLKAENAQLKNHEIELKAENEVLRKQVADLSPFKNASPQDYRASNKCLACGDYHHGLGNLPCPRCTPVAQSAMAKESSHD